MTPINRQTFDALVAWVASHGYPPSIRELADAMGLAHSVAYRRLRLLEDAGLIEWPASSLGSRRSRTMRLVKKEGA